VLNGVIRFALHGCVIRSSDGRGVHLTSHLLRHGFATEMASRNVPVDVIAAMLHQRDTTVTQYYSRPTQTQVLEAAEIIFEVERKIARKARAQGAIVAFPDPKKHRAKIRKLEAEEIGP